MMAATDTVTILIMAAPILPTTAPVITDNVIALADRHQQSFALNSAPDLPGYFEIHFETAIEPAEVDHLPVP